MRFHLTSMATKPGLAPAERSAELLAMFIEFEGLGFDEGFGA